MGNELENQRPKIITLFVTLTFLFCGIMILFAVVPDSVFNPDNNPDNVRNPYIQFGDVAISLIKIIGGILLLRMKKMGFYLYTLGEIAYVAMLIPQTLDEIEKADNYMFPADMPVDPAILVAGFSGLLILCSIIWISVYASRLRQMT